MRTVRLTYFVALTLSANDVLCWDLEVVEIQGTCGGGSDAQFLFLLGNLNAHVFGGNEAGYAFVAFARVYLFQVRCQG
jgi:hypothetical protein